MCNNVYKWFLRAFAVVAALTVISCADSPDEDDIVIPECSLSIDGTTIEEGNTAMMTFDETGGTKQFSIKTTGEWEITGLESAPQGFALTTSKGEEKYTGKGDETFTITLGEATTASRFSVTVNVYASIFGQKKVADTQTITIVQTKGGVLPEGKVIYNNNFDKEEATQTYNGTYWPYLDQFEGWKNQTGEGAAEVTYDFKSVSARANSKSDGSYSNYAGSGSNNLLFGGSGYLTIQNIAVSTTNLQLTFGTERYAYGENDNTFKNEEFLVTLSADGQSWSAPIAYSFPEGNDTNGKWNLATADFTLPDGTTKLYIKFATTLSGAHRVDDVKLTDGIGGQAITFEGGGDQPDQPTPPTPGDAIYTNNFDKEAATQTDNKWPYLDQFEGWKNHQGSGAAEVTYDFKSVSARSNSASDSQYSNYAGSGVNNLLFGNGGYFTIQNIAVSSTNLQLTFGTERYAYGESDNTFKNEEFLVTLSADGQSWSAPITYAFEAGKDTNGKWNVATANFTLPDGTTKLYIKFATTLSGAHRLDDVTLTTGNGGQAITFEGGGDTPTPPTPGDAIYTNNFDKEKATQTDNKWPYLDQFEGWKNHAGSGAAEVTYDFKSVSARSNSASDSQYSNYAGSGVNNLLFGNGGYFTIQNIAVSSTNLQLTFGTERYAYGESDNTFKNEEFLVTLSADGQSWSAPITYAFEAGKDTNGKWNVATADFTLPSGTTKLYIKFASTLSGAHRLDDVTLTTGNGGQSITFEGGGDEPDQPTPPTPAEDGTITMSAADIIANGTTAITENSYGSQNVDDASTYYTWKMNDVTFAGAKICKATNEDYAGLIQMQGNASDKAKQGFFGNTVDLKKITKVVVVSRNTKYEPTEHLYVGTSAYPLGQNAVTRTDMKQEGQTYTETFDISGDFGYFALANDKQGAFYVESVTVYYGGESGGNQPGGDEPGGDEPDQPTPPTPAESGTITMSNTDIITNGTTTITENSYGSQNVNDASTYYTWKMNDVTFAGAKICKATSEDYAGLIQMQGNASDKNKQGFLGNADDLKKITKVVVVSKNTKYEPTEHLYVGTSAYPLGQNAVTRTDMKQEGQTYTETFDVSGDFGYFVVANDKQGAFYIESVTVYYGK